MKNLYQIAVSSAVGSVVLVSGMFVAPNANAETNLLLNHYMSAKHPMVGKVVRPWAKQVTVATQGRVKVEIPVAKITGPKKQWNSVASGTAGLSISSDSFQRKRLRLMDVGRLPFGGTTAKKTAIGLWRTYHKFIKPANIYKGVKFLSIWTPAQNVVFTRSRQITSADHFKGLKMRANAGLGAKSINMLGGSAVTSSGTEIFSLVSKGVVDGMVFPPDGIARFKVGKYLKYATIIPGALYVNSWSYIMNKKQWDGISKPDQKAIMAVSGEVMGAAGGAMFDKRGDAALANLESKEGMEKNTASPAMMAALRKKLVPLQEEYFKDAAKKGIDGKAALAYFRSQAQ